MSSQCQLAHIKYLTLYHCFDKVKDKHMDILSGQDSREASADGVPTDIYCGTHNQAETRS